MLKASRASPELAQAVAKRSIVSRTQQAGLMARLFSCAERGVTFWGSGTGLYCNRRERIHFNSERLEEADVGVTKQERLAEDGDNSFPQHIVAWDSCEC